MFFAFHDDTVSPDYTERLVEALQRNPRAVLAYCDLDLTQADGTSMGISFDVPTAGMGPMARGFTMATKTHGWWAPVHGLFRAEAFHRIGGFKHHDEGEFIADWPWLLHMAILGEFERVPEPLCQKFIQKTGLSKGWERNVSQQMAMIRSGIREIRHSDLGPLSKMALMAILKSRHARMKASSLTPQPLKTFVKRLLKRG
jgi:hypothetical protein